MVFVNSVSGIKCVPHMCTDVLEEAIQRIQTAGNPAQHYMFYIYTKYQMGVRLHGTNYDTYKYCKSIAGSAVKEPRLGHMTYALTNQTSMAWFFTDNMFDN